LKQPFSPKSRSSAARSNPSFQSSVVSRVVQGAESQPWGAVAPGGAVAPKYRNPENPAETWAGRGLKPRWLTAAIKGGKKIEDFAIAGAAGSSKANGGKKARKARK
jgi:hypothetical protein